MADKLLICVSAEQVTAGCWRGRRFSQVRLFRNDDSGFAAFDEFLASFSGTPAYFMVDAVEEDYRFETLPHAFGSDRSEMVRRKLRQHYRNSPFVNAWFVGRDTDRRRDDRYLFSALTNPDLIGPWLRAAAGRALPIAGVYLLPMASIALIAALRLKAANMLLVSQHAAGLRLTFVRDHQFRLSRLTRGDGGRSGGQARFITEEISNTRIYLHALRAARLDEHLTVVLLDRNDELAEAVVAIARDNPGLECVHVGRRELSSRLRLEESLLGLSGDVIFLQLLGREPPPGNLAPASVTGGFGRYRLRRAVYATAGIAALAAAGWSGLNLWQAVLAHRDKAEAARQTTQLQASYREVTRQFPAAPTTAANLEKTVEVAERVRQATRTPEILMSVVSKALEGSPGIVLRGLGWKHGRSEIEGVVPTARPAGTAPTPAAGNPPRRQTGLVEGEVRPFRGDYRAAIEAIHAFAERLARDPAVAEARILKLPLNVNPTLSLSGNTMDSGEAAGAAEFKLLLVLKANS